MISSHTLFPSLRTWSWNGISVEVRWRRKVGIYIERQNGSGRFWWNVPRVEKMIPSSSSDRSEAGAILGLFFSSLVVPASESCRLQIFCRSSAPFMMSLLHNLRKPPPPPVKISSAVQDTISFVSRISRWPLILLTNLVVRAPCPSNQLLTSNLNFASVARVPKCGDRSKLWRRLPPSRNTFNSSIFADPACSRPSRYWKFLSIVCDCGYCVPSYLASVFCPPPLILGPWSVVTLHRCSAFWTRNFVWDILILKYIFFARDRWGSKKTFIAGISIAIPAFIMFSVANALARTTCTEKFYLDCATGMPGLEGLLHFPPKS